MKSRFEIMSGYYKNTLEDGDLELYISQYMTSEEKMIGKPFFLMNDDEQRVYDVMRYNNQVGNLTGYNCAKCKNKGYIQYINDENYIITKECSCRRIRSSIDRLNECGLGSLLDIYTFDKYKTDLQWQKTVKEQAIKFVNSNNKCFVILGSSGAGKSHICTAIAKELMLKNMSFRFMSWIEDSNSLKANKMNSDKYFSFIAELKNVDVLYIDDFFKTENNSKPTPADISLAMEIINFRYNQARSSNRRMVTIISSERTMDKLISYDEAIAGRLKEMAGEYLITITGDDKNYRFKENT